jgi:hypothetical protein
MKGHLQRLVQTVTNPANSVHPWAGSIFAAGHQGDFNIVQTEELAPLHAARQPSEGMAPASAQSFQALASTGTSPSAERNSLIPELRATQMSSGSPQAGQNASRGPSVSERIIPKPLITNTEESVRESMDAAELDMTPAQKPEPALPPRGHRSLAGAEALIKPGNTRQLALGSSLAPKEKNDASAARNSVAADRRTDEIQIHIGRIEVTAIHPPAPKGPKVRDKELSLDAYLKRRDGRAG